MGLLKPQQYLYDTAIITNSAEAAVEGRMELSNVTWKESDWAKTATLELSPQQMTLLVEEYGRDYAGRLPNMRSLTRLESVVKGKMRARACKEPLTPWSSSKHRQSVCAFRARYSRRDSNSSETLVADSGRFFVEFWPLK